MARMDCIKPTVMAPRFGIVTLITAATISTILMLAFYWNTLAVLGIGLSHLMPAAASNTPSTVSQTGAVKGTPIMLEKNTSNRTSDQVTLVFATMAGDNNSWVDDELGDMYESGLGTAFYVTNDLSAPHHTPANKGHEAMAYLTYMIDSYDSLPPISIFLHAHPKAWHDNYLLDMSTPLMIRNLNFEKVNKEGYMNLRCHWNPGCPSGLNPMATEFDPDKKEELEVKGAWAELFPFDALPEKLAQPCCSQFAVTRERIRNLPRERYVHFRDWLLKTDLEDYISGRLFEYFWQYMLNSSPVYCPDPRICFCDGYNICFENASDYEKYFELATEAQKLDKQLKAWQEWKHITERDVDDGVVESTGFVQIDPKFQSVKELAGSEEGKKLDPNVVDKWDRGDWLRYHLDQLLDKMYALKDEAFAAGKDPARKATALNAAQETPMKLPAGHQPWWL